MPPFQPKHSDLELLEIVRAVSVVADPDSPATVSQTTWDESRAKAGHPDAPLARTISADRFGVPWPRVLRIAHGNLDDALRALGNAAADKGRKGVTLPRIATALRQVATRLDKPGINRREYKDGRESIILTSRGPARTAARRSLPELTQVETVLKQNEMSWEAGLVFAGLEVPILGSIPGLSADASVRLFAVTKEKVPRTRTQLRRWANHHGIACARMQQPAFEAAVAALQDERAAAGLAALPAAPKDEDLAEPVPVVAPDAPAKRAKEWDDKEAVIRGMAKAVRLLRGKQLTQRSLKETARKHPGRGIPGYSQVDSCRQKYYPGETWRQWVTEATTLAKSGATL